MDNPLGILPPGLEQFGVQRERTEGASRLGQEAFLELMVAQLQHQDPLKPMESGDFLGQIAQFSTASGIADLQGSFTTLADALQSNQALQASTMVGRTVLVAGDTVDFDGAGAVRGAAELAQGSGEVVVNVHDAAGQLLKRLSLGAREAGPVQFTWNGLDDAGAAVPAGSYRIEVQALTGDGPVSVPAWVPAKVESVSLRAGGTPQLNLAGRGAVGLGEVKQVM